MVVVAAVLEGIREAAPPLEVAHQSHAEEVLREDQEEEALAIAVAKALLLAVEEVEEAFEEAPLLPLESSFLTPGRL